MHACQAPIRVATAHHLAAHVGTRHRSCTKAPAVLCWPSERAMAACLAVPVPCCRDGVDGSPLRPRPGAKLPVWARLAGTPAATQLRDRPPPAAPRVFRAVQAKTMSLGLVDADSALGLGMGIGAGLGPDSRSEPMHFGGMADASGHTVGGRPVWPANAGPAGVGWARGNAAAAAIANAVAGRMAAGVADDAGVGRAESAGG